MFILFFAATFDRTGRYVITGSDDRLVKIWAMETTFCLASCRGHEVSLLLFHISIYNFAWIIYPVGSVSFSKQG